MNCEKCYKPSDDDEPTRKPWRVSQSVFMLGNVPAELCSPCRREFHEHINEKKAFKAYYDAKDAIEYLGVCATAGAVPLRDEWMDWKRRADDAFRELRALSKAWLAEEVIGNATEDSLPDGG